MYKLIEHALSIFLRTTIKNLKLDHNKASNLIFNNCCCFKMFTMENKYFLFFKNQFVVLITA